MMIEGSGSIPLTSGSGSGRPKNMWIQIRNAGCVGSFGILISGKRHHVEKCEDLFCIGAHLLRRKFWHPQ
jgi:hypothetical protein